ncbi:unnamed protein product [Penicillium discolor]
MKGYGHFSFLCSKTCGYLVEKLTDNTTSSLALAARVHADGVSPSSTKGVLSSRASPVVGAMAITASMVPVPDSCIFKIGNNQASGVLGRMQALGETKLPSKTVVQSVQDEVLQACTVA